MSISCSRVVHPGILHHETESIFVHTGILCESKFNWIKVCPGISWFVSMKASSFRAQVKVSGSKTILE